LIDYDYVSKLSPKEKAWLNKFTEEYTNASIKKDKKPLHKTKEHTKDCYDRNNARNRCILTRAKASGSTVDYEELKQVIKKEEEIKSVDSLEETTFDALLDSDKLDDSDNSGK
jgi:hypothetical protein